jgi:hypothetical protein
LKGGGSITQIAIRSSGLLLFLAAHVSTNASVVLSFVFLSSFILPALETVITVINHKVSSVMSRFSFPSPTLFCFNNKKKENYNLELLEYLPRIF